MLVTVTQSEAVQTPSHPHHVADSVEVLQRDAGRRDTFADKYERHNSEVALIVNCSHTSVLSAFACWLMRLNPNHCDCGPVIEMHSNLNSF